MDQRQWNVIFRHNFCSVLLECPIQFGFHLIAPLHKCVKWFAAYLIFLAPNDSFSIVQCKIITLETAVGSQLGCFVTKSLSLPWGCGSIHHQTRWSMLRSKICLSTTNCNNSQRFIRIQYCENEAYIKIKIDFLLHVLPSNLISCSMMIKKWF